MMMTVLLQIGGQRFGGESGGGCQSHMVTVAKSVALRHLFYLAQVAKQPEHAVALHLPQRTVELRNDFCRRTLAKDVPLMQHKDTAAPRSLVHICCGYQNGDIVPLFKVGQHIPEFS